MRLILGLLILTVMGLGQTTLDMAGAGPGTIQIVSPGCSGTPLVCTVNADPVALGLAAGDKIVVFGACSTGTNHISSATGLRKIKSRTTSTITLMDYSGVDVASNGTWCLGNITGQSEGIQAIRRVTTYSLPDHPRVWFDGPTGEITNRLSSEPVSLIVNSSHVATLTTSFDVTTQGIPLVTGATISLWNTTNTTLTPANNGKEYSSITVVDPHTITFTVNSGIPAADYTSNPHCGPTLPVDGTIGGTLNCVRWSQEAIAASPWWAGMLTLEAGVIGGGYKFIFQGGAGTTYSTPSTTNIAKFAVHFMVDQKRQDLVDAAWDWMDHAEMISGNNFFTNENATDGGHYALAEDTNAPWAADVATGFTVFRGYGTSSRKQTFIDKMINNTTDPTPCTPVHPSPVAVTTGTATAGDATHITLAVGSSGTNSFYNNNAIEVVLASGAHTFGTVTAYNGTTLQATVTSWNNGNPANGSTYSIWQTATLSGTTLTGYNTAWNTVGAGQLHVGDFLMGVTNWTGFFDVGALGVTVATITNDTTITVTRNASLVMFNSTPATVWPVSPWVTGNCGYTYVQAHFGGHPGQPIQYGTRGGSTSKNPDGTIILGSNNVYAMNVNLLALFIAFADDDSRAQFDAAAVSALSVDTHLAFAQSYVTGLSQSGANYGYGTTLPAMHRMAGLFKNNLIGFPNMDTNGPWVNAEGEAIIYTMHPDKPWSQNNGVVVPYVSYFGGNNTASNFAQACGHCASVALNHGIIFNPQETTSKYFAYFLKNVLVYDTYQRAGSQYLPEMVIKLPVNQPMTDYKVQPLQYLFRQTSYATAVSSFGWGMASTIRSDAFVSRTGWSSTSDTHLFVRVSTYTGDHDDNQPLKHDLYKVGYLLSNNFLIPGDSENPGNTVTQNSLQFGATNTLRNGYGNSDGPGIAYIDRWSGTEPYGDPNSEFACARGTAAGAYTNPTLTYAIKYFCHFKLSDEVLITYTKTASSSAIIHKEHFMFPQNLELASVVFNVIYDEGDTTCPGSGGCASINTTHLTDGVLEQEDGDTQTGATRGAGTPSPPRVYNLAAKFWSPGTVTYNWAGAPSPGNAYKLEAYGAGTVGGTSTGLESGMAACVLTQPATSCPAVVAVTGATWTGINTASKAAFFARDNATHNTLTGATVSLSDPGQVVIEDLDPGTYTLSIGGFNCGTKVVTAGDNSIYCKTTGTITGGAVTLGQGAAGTMTVNGSGKVVGSGKVAK